MFPLSVLVLKMLCVGYFWWYQAEITDKEANSSNENSSLLFTLKKVLESYLSSGFQMFHLRSPKQTQLNWKSMYCK